MSLFKVEYFLEAKFTGLSPGPNGLQKCTLIKKEKLFVPLRGIDKLPTMS